jgi:hypothetical protein
MRVSYIVAHIPECAKLPQGRLHRLLVSLQLVIELCNPNRLLSTLVYVSPIDFEKRAGVG